MSPMPKRGSFANMDELYEFMRTNDLGSLGEDNDGQLVIYTGCIAMTPPNASGITKIEEIVELRAYVVKVTTPIDSKHFWTYQATDTRHAAEQFFDDPPMTDDQIQKIEIRKVTT